MSVVYIQNGSQVGLINRIRLFMFQ